MDKVRSGMTPSVISHSSNFEYLKEHDSVFFQLAHNAERIFVIDPNTSLIELR
jgi:type I restriction enzyme R subunit